MNRDAMRELARALLARAGDGATIAAGWATEWGSLTFEGHRHELRLALPVERAAVFAEQIGEAEFDLIGHIVADIVLIGRVDVGGTATFDIEALTLVDQ